MWIKLLSLLKNKAWEWFYTPDPSAVCVSMYPGDITAWRIVAVHPADVAYMLIGLYDRSTYWVTRYPGDHIIQLLISICLA